MITAALMACRNPACGAAFTPKQARSLFCSIACRQAWVRRPVARATTCEHCKAPLPAFGRRSRVFCTDECRRAEKRIRIMQGKQPPDRVCLLPGCDVTFTATQPQRQYCCEAHRIKGNNDRRIRNTTPKLPPVEEPAMTTHAVEITKYTGAIAKAGLPKVVIRGAIKAFGDGLGVPNHHGGSIVISGTGALCDYDPDDFDRITCGGPVGHHQMPIDPDDVIWFGVAKRGGVEALTAHNGKALLTIAERAAM